MKMLHVLQRKSPLEIERILQLFATKSSESNKQSPPMPPKMAEWQAGRHMGLGKGQEGVTARPGSMLGESRMCMFWNLEVTEYFRQNFRGSKDVLFSLDLLGSPKPSVFPPEHAPTLHDNCLHPSTRTHGRFLH